MRETEEERTRRLIRVMMSESVAHWRGSFYATQWETTIPDRHIIDSSYTKDLIKFKKFNFNFKFM